MTFKTCYGETASAVGGKQAQNFAIVLALSPDRIAEEWEGLYGKLKERDAHEREEDAPQRETNEVVAVASVESATHSIYVGVGCDPVQHRSSEDIDQGSLLSAEDDLALTKKSVHNGEESITNGEAVTLDNMHVVDERARDQEITRVLTEGLGSAGGDAENAGSTTWTELGEDILDGEKRKEASDAMAVSEGFHGRYYAEEEVSKVEGVTTSTTKELQSNALSRPIVDLLEISDTESSDGDRARWLIGGGEMDGTESSLDLASMSRDACSEGVHGDKDAFVSWVVGRMGLLEKVGL